MAPTYPPYYMSDDFVDLVQEAQQQNRFDSQVSPDQLAFNVGKFVTSTPLMNAMGTATAVFIIVVLFAIIFSFGTLAIWMCCIKFSDIVKMEKEDQDERDAHAQIMRRNFQIDEQQKKPILPV